MRYIKNTAVLITVIFMMMISVCSVYAKGQESFVFDLDNSFSENEEEKLNEKISEYSGKLGINIAIVSADDLEGKNSEEYADDLYDKIFGINTDGVLLLIDNYSQWDHISTSGTAIHTYSDSDIDSMFGFISPKLKAHHYYEAADKFLDVLDTDVLRALEKRHRLLTGTIAGIIGGAVMSLSACAIVGHRYKSKEKYSPRNYAAGNDIRFIVKNDRFIRQYTTKTKIESSSGGGTRGGSSTHFSSSGGMHGGGSHHR